MTSRRSASHTTLFARIFYIYMFRPYQPYIANSQYHTHHSNSLCSAPLRSFPAPIRPPMSTPTVYYFAFASHPVVLNRHFYTYIPSVYLYLRLGRCLACLFGFSFPRINRHPWVAHLPVPGLAGHTHQLSLDHLYRISAS
jgi:hypothetical protein